MGLPRERFTGGYRRLSKARWAKLLEEALGILILHIWIMCEIISNFKNIFTPSSELGVRTDFWCQLTNSGQICVRDMRSWEWYSYTWLQLLCGEGGLLLEQVQWTAESLSQSNLGLHSPWFSGGVTPIKSFNIWRTQFSPSKTGWQWLPLRTRWDWTG